MAHAIVNRDATLTRLRDELDRLRRTPLTGEGGARRRERVQRSPALSLSPFPASGRIDGPTLRAARRLNRATGILATSVLLDSAVEHYRGSFNNPAMIVPLIVSALTLGVGAHGTADKRPVAHRARQAIYATGAVTGLLGTGFHIYNVLKRPGAPAWQNLFYGAPVGAPMAILLAGLLGSAAEAVRDNPPQRARVLGLPAGRLLSTRERPGSSGHHRRSCTVALSRCVPRSGDVCACDDPASRRRIVVACRVWREEPQSVAGALVVAPRCLARGCGCGVPRLGRATKHGRLAELAPELAERSTDIGPT